MSSIEVNGLKYFYRTHGSGPILLLLHGFSGSSQNWLEFLDRFSKQHQLFLFDLPGHGRTDSPADPERYSMDHVSRDLLTIFRTLKLSAINLAGYSMGGRLALYMAVNHPALLNSLIIESASPGLETETLRQARVESDKFLAQHIMERGIPEFIEHWQQHPLFATQNRLPEARRENLRLQRLNNSARGLANSLRGMGTGQQPSLWAELESIRLPVLIMAGRLDQKYANIAQQMASAISKSTLRIIPDAGHNIHLEQPERFASSILEFLTGFTAAARD